MGNGTVHRSSAYWEMGLEALDFKNYVAVNYTLIRKYGLHAAVLIGELASKARYYKRKEKLVDGWFFATVEDIEEHTGLNAYYQRETLKVLQDMGVIEIKYSGLPRKRYFRVDAMRIIEEMGAGEETAVQRQCSTDLTTRDASSEPLEVDLVDDNNLKEQLKGTTKKQESKKPRTYDAIIAERTDNPALKEAIGEFIRMRARIKKPLTDRALTLRLDKLWRLGATDDERVAIAEQSIAACWQDFYPLKEEKAEHDFGGYDFADPIKLDGGQAW